MATILIVDDDPDRRAWLASLLGSQGHRLLEASDVAEALRAARGAPPALVVAGIPMPTRDGCEFARRLRAMPAMARIPVILRTAHGRARESIREAPPASPEQVHGWICLADTFGAEDEWLVAVLDALVGQVDEHGRSSADERRRAEAARRASEQRLQLALEASRLVAWSWDAATDRTVLAKTAQDVIGLAGTVLAGALPESEWVHPDDRARYRAVVSDAQKRQCGYTAEFRVVRPDNGATVWLEDRGHVESSAAGPLPGLSGVLLDITERRRAAASRRQHELRFQAIFHHTFEQVALLRPDGTVLEINQPALDGSGLKAAEVVGRPLWESRWLEISSANRARMQAAVAAAAGGELVRSEVAARDALGRLRTFDCSLKPVKDEAGGVDLLIVEARDITEHKLLEQQYLQAQRMEAVGQLAGGVAHDFNNLLTVICGYSDLIHRGLRPDAPQRELLDEVRKAGARASMLTRQLLAFSRKQVIQPRVLDLNAVLADARNLLARLISENVELHFCAGPALGRVKVDPGQIEQVLMNLAVNARDAMPHGGKLFIQTRNVAIEAGHTCDPAMPLGAYVLVEVSDTGTGMTEDVKQHLFEPFFTTKQPGAGTGLGLATVYGIVKQSGGGIQVYSEPGHGTTFKLYFPRVEEPVGKARPSGILAPPRRGSETILLVEDEPMIRSLVQTILREHGYRVLAATEGADGLRQAAEHAGPIHLLVADVVMPRLSGQELAERLTAARPSLRVLFMSGYAGAVLAHHGVLEEQTAFLQKPFAPLELLRKIREVLDQPHEDPLA